MSAAPVAVLTRGRGRPDEADVAVFESLLDDAFLAEAGWDAGRMVLVTPPDHPLLGLTLCRVVGCGTRGRGPLQLCGRCVKRLPVSGLPLEEFLSVPWTVRTAGLQPCAVPGCGRPWATSSHLLCHELAEVKLDLDDRDTDLAAARNANRELMTRLNGRTVEP